MCVVALALKAHPDWPLILIGNRDELHARPAAPLAEWGDGSGIVAGRDLQAGGTWLGVHRPSGRAVVVTNVRGAMPDPAKESRGLRSVITLLCVPVVLRRRKLVQVRLMRRCCPSPQC